MTTHETRNHNYADHQAAWEQLPWYVNGTLEGAELAEVERHVANCVACRAELNALRELAALIQSVPELPLSPEASLRSVLARIEGAREDQAGLAEEAAPVWRRRIGSGPQRRRFPWVRAALLGQAAAILLLAGLLAFPPERRTDGEYRTLSAAGRAPADAGARINLVFAPDTTEARMRELVSSVGGQIVAGPTAIGVYTISTPLAKSGDPSRERLLERLRARPEILFAELAVAAR